MTDQERLEQIRMRIAQTHDVPPGERVVELSVDEFSFLDDQAAQLDQAQERIEALEYDSSHIVIEAAELRGVLTQVRLENARLREAAKYIIRVIKTCTMCDECIREAEAALAQSEDKNE